MTRRRGNSASVHSPGRRASSIDEGYKSQRGLWTYERDRTIWERSRTVRGQMWERCIDAAKDYLVLKEEQWGENDRDLRVKRGILRGAAIVYATFVDGYAMNDREHKPLVIKRIEQEAVRTAKEDRRAAAERDASE